MTFYIGYRMPGIGRSGLLKRDGELLEFYDREEAEAEAKRLRDSQSPHLAGGAHYWVEEG